MCSSPCGALSTWLLLLSASLYRFKAKCDIIEAAVYRTTCKGQVSVQMYIICRSGKFEFNLDKIVEAITKASKATLNRMNTRITKEIQQLLDSGDNALEDYPHSQWLYERIAELERMRKYIKLLKEMKSNRVPAKLRTLWLCRIKNSSRTLASTSLDPMSIALPVPPTFEATLSSFGRGRDLNALPC